VIPVGDNIPRHLRPVVSRGLIVLCVLAFLWQLSLDPTTGQQVIYALGVIPAVLFGHAHLPVEMGMVSPAATVVTSMFLHGGWLHLGGNLLYLWIFGDNVEDGMGHLRFLTFYLACGVVAVGAQALPDPASVVPMIGASGAISGVLGAYLLLFPRARVFLVFPFVPRVVAVPAALVLGLWFLVQVLQSASVPAGAGGIAFAAHIGGFIAGIVFAPFFRRRGFPLLGGGRRG
jgi:membrane associated rhomboid family serine protease